jgi:hypothetical protein
MSHSGWAVGPAHMRGAGWVRLEGGLWGLAAAELALDRPAEFGRLAWSRTPGGNQPPPEHLECHLQEHFGFC